MKNTRMLLILALAVISGLGAGYSALNYLGDRSTPLTPDGDGDPETQPVVLASRDLPLGKVLDETDLIQVEWPAATVPSGFAATTEELVGRSLLAGVQANEVILASKLADAGLYGIVPLIPEGMRALAVKVDEVVGVAGFVTPQTRVDVILIMTPPGGREPISKVILQNIQALAAGQQIQETEDGTPITVTVVTVLVTPEEAERLALAATEGRIQMALRNTLDQEDVVTSGERASRLFAGVGSAARGGAATMNRSTPIPATPQESIIEIYRGGARTLISYN
jgi:pilus assembly protein CpaB